MKKRYKILILSNPQNEELLEDISIADSFKEDGNIVDINWVDYNEALDDHYDVIIRRNTWVEDEKDIEYFKTKNDEMKKRLIKKNIKTVNLIGLDGEGKGYLCELHERGKQVVPTIDNLEDLEKLGKADKYIIKDNASFGSGLKQESVTENELCEKFRKGYLIQPKLNFISEVQCYFVGNELMYVLEYTPSKYPNYPEPRLISLTEKERQLAIEFANTSNLKYGFQRIDFLRLLDNSFILLEIEDNSPHMSIEKLDVILKNKVLNAYKENVYDYLKS